MPIENIGKKCSPPDDQAGSFSGHDLLNALHQRGLDTENPLIDPEPQEGERVDVQTERKAYRKLKKAFPDIPQSGSTHDSLESSWEEQDLLDP